MLSISKVLTISGTSKLETDEVLATMHCSIGQNGMISKTTTVVNQNLYDANIEKAYNDEDEFTELCREEAIKFKEGGTE